MIVKNKKILTPADLKTLTQNAAGKITALYLHWTGGKYGDCYDNYHLCINKNGEWETAADMQSFLEKRKHTNYRQENTMGIALEAGRGVKNNNKHAINWGKQGIPTLQQITALIAVCALLCLELKLPVSEDTVLTGAEAADLDGYGIYDNTEEYAWDLLRLPHCGAGSGGDYIRRKIREELQT